MNYVFIFFCTKNNNINNKRVIFILIIYTNKIIFSVLQIFEKKSLDLKNY